MPLNVTLGEIVDRIKKEIRGSANPSQMQSFTPIIKDLAKRVQEWLYGDNPDWEHLKNFRVDKNILAGERFYTFDSDLNFLRIDSAWIKYNTQWTPLTYGISPNDYNYQDSEDDVRSDPVLKWNFYSTLTDDPNVGQFEIWPLPASAQTLRFYGMRKLRPLIADDDRCDIDDTLIVLFAAAELLTDNNMKSATAKLQLAQQLYNKTKGRSVKSGVFVMGGGSGNSKNYRNPCECPIRILGS